MTAGPPCIPAVILIRAAKPLEGSELMRRNRNLSDDVTIHKLTNGPSKFCQAFENTDELNGANLTSHKLFLFEGQQSLFEIAESARIGIDYAGE